MVLKLVLKLVFRLIFGWLWKNREVKGPGMDEETITLRGW